MAETSAVQIGPDCSVYRNAGTYGTPTWTEIALVRNVTIGAPWTMSDASIRGTRAILEAKTQPKVGGSIECRADPADAGYQALFDGAMAVSGSAPDLLILDGPVTQEGVKGLRLHANLNFNQNQEIGGVVYTSFDVSAAWHASGYPSYAEVGASSAVTFTAF